MGGGGEGRGGEPISPLLRNSGAPSALKKIVDTSSYLCSLFHSVIYNSVGKSKESNVESPAEGDSPLHHTLSVSTLNVDRDSPSSYSTEQ